MNNRAVNLRIARIFLAFATAVVVLGGMLFAAAPPRVTLGQNGERPPSSVQDLADPGPSAPTASWTAATPYPQNISRYGFAQNGEDMYLISGTTRDGITFSVNTVRRYDPTANVWTSLADIPVASAAPTAAFHGGKIYVANGFRSGGGNDFQIYDIATNTWSAGPPRPGVTDSEGAAAGGFNGKIFVVGGDTFSSTILSIYDIASNTWSVGPASPSAYSFGGYTQIGQFLYLIGSRVFTDVNNSVSMRLDMATNTWSTGPAWTPQRADFALAAAGTRLFAIGGDNNGGSTTGNPSAQVHELETSTWPAGAWSASPDSLPSPRQGNSAGFFSTGRAGGEIWSTGGIAADTNTFLTEHVFRPAPIACLDYNVTESTRALEAASSDTGTHCNDCMTASTAINFPFPISFYGTVYTSARASSNGNLQFNSVNASPTHTNLPATGFNATIFAYWDNVRTDLAGGGIFTSVAGTAPNRIYTIEWRVSNNTGAGTANFEIRFFEGSTDFEILYGARSGTFTGTIGVQRDASSLFTQFAGPAAQFPAAGTRLLFTTDCCAPIAFRGAIGSNSTGYPGASGSQTGRLTREGDPSACGALKGFPGTTTTTARAFDQYSFTNNGPATCVTFDINSDCTDSGMPIFAAAYLGSFNPANLATNYRGDTGFLLTAFRSFAVNVPANTTVVLVVNEVNAGAACPTYDVVVRGLSCPLELVTAVSRKTHSSAGEFDIPLPLTGEPAVECRSANATHKLVFTFNSEITAGTAAVTAGNATAGPVTFSGTTMIVPLSGVTDIQKVTVTLSGVTNSVGQVLPDTAVSMKVLLGDTTGNKVVNASDIGQTKARSGQAVSAANFRSDTTVGGLINSSDIGQVKANSGHAVP